ncbi:MAG: S16 family serine protease [Ornithinibacter sp.]
MYPRRPGRLSAALLVGTFVIIALAAALSFVGLPYVVLLPGPATNILGDEDGSPILSVKGAPTYPTAGNLDYTTVLVEGGPGRRNITVYDLARAGLRDSEVVVPVEQVYPPDASQKQVQQEGAAQMAASQTVATATALRALGREVDQVVDIASVPEGSPSAGVIEPGDVLVSVDGDAATDPDAVRTAVKRNAPGDTIAVVVTRGGKRRTLEVTAGKASDGSTIIGVNLRVDYDLPVEVTVNTGSVGGPSAGLMFSLAIYDVLTPGELTGGTKIAGTGEMTDSGAVGPIGGIRQKLVGARDAGATVFLAPADNCSEVVGHVPDGLQVVRVATFAEGLAAVEKVAKGEGSALRACT